MKLPITVLCSKVGMSRQNFYKSREVRQRNKVNELLVKQLVQTERAIQPRIGGLKLHSLLRPELDEAGTGMGRDRFFEVLGNQGLLLEPLPKAPRTTNSHHRLPVFTNLIKNIEPTRTNQVWVSDITYIRTREEFVYLSLITDKYSRKIVGYHLAKTLEAQDTLKALDMALRQKPADANPIHHSDRGNQYCSHVYVERLNEHHLPISMTEKNHCAENSMAERMNGILKQEYFLKHEFQSFKQACQAVKEAIYLYNIRRPHRSLKLRTPDQVHSTAA